MIKLERASASYQRGLSRKKKTVLHDISIEINENEVVGIVGNSGSGKSTIAKVLLKLLPLDAGQYTYFDQDITNIAGKNIPSFYQRIQYVSQFPHASFDHSYRIEYSVLEPLKNFGVVLEEEILYQWLDRLQISASILKRYPHQVSGGEIQRLCLLRILLLNPKLIILDEATSMLDISVQAKMLEILKKLHKDMGYSYMVISHDPLLIEYMCDRVYKIQEGRIIES